VCFLCHDTDYRSCGGYQTFALYENLIKNILDKILKDHDIMKTSTLLICASALLASPGVFANTKSQLESNINARLDAAANFIRDKGVAEAIKVMNGHGEPNDVPSAIDFMLGTPDSGGKLLCVEKNAHTVGEKIDVSTDPADLNTTLNDVNIEKLAVALQANADGKAVIEYKVSGTNPISGNAEEKSMLVVGRKIPQRDGMFCYVTASAPAA
jgi:hypothetical protein